MDSIVISNRNIVKEMTEAFLKGDIEKVNIFGQKILHGIFQVIVALQVYSMEKMLF